jgi:hypothetical protein
MMIIIIKFKFLTPWLWFKESDINRWLLGTRAVNSHRAAKRRTSS